MKGRRRKIKGIRMSLKAFLERPSKPVSAQTIKDSRSDKLLVSCSAKETLSLKQTNRSTNRSQPKSLISIKRPSFWIKLDNLDTSVTKDEIRNFFKWLQIKYIYLPPVDQNGEQRDFAYVQLYDRPTLKEALSYTGYRFKHKTLDINVPNDSDDYVRKLEKHMEDEWDKCEDIRHLFVQNETIE